MATQNIFGSSKEYWAMKATLTQLLGREKVLIEVNL